MANKTAGHTVTIPRQSSPEGPIHSGSQRFALLVAAGILLSRIAGLVRDRVFAHYFGNSDSADAFKAAFRIPNFLQNLFGEGVLSASFIPVYAGLMARGDQEAARRTAGSVAALLGLVTSLLALLGVAAAPILVDVIAPGFSGEKRGLTIQLTRILFPGAGLLVLSAWCLGVLNSHRRFFLSYAAPVAWNLAMIVAMIVFGGSRGQYPLALILAWASVAGSALQVCVQMPIVLKLLGTFRLALFCRSENVRTVVRNFIPVFVGRGVVQISAYIDALLSSLLPTGAVAAMSYAQTLYTLPVSLFGMSVSAAELPLMSGELGDSKQVGDALKARINAGLRRITFFVVPSMAAFLALGDVIVAAIYQTGQFGRADVLYVWGILAGAALGLPASTCGRLYASAYYALHDTRTPLRFALTRVALTTVLGWFCALKLPAMLGVAPRWGVAGLMLSSGIAAWIEYALLRRVMNRRIGRSGIGIRFMASVGAAACLAAAAGLVLNNQFATRLSPLLSAVAVLLPYGLIYLAVTVALRLPEARAFVKRN